MFSVLFIMEKRVSLSFPMSAGRRVQPQSNVNKAKLEKVKNQKLGHWMTNMKSYL